MARWTPPEKREKNEAINAAKPTKRTRDREANQKAVENQRLSFAQAHEQRQAEINAVRFPTLSDSFDQFLSEVCTDESKMTDKEKRLLQIFYNAGALYIFSLIMQFTYLPDAVAEACMDRVQKDLESTNGVDLKASITKKTEKKT